MLLFLAADADFYYAIPAVKLLLTPGWPAAPETELPLTEPGLPFVLDDGPV